MRVIWLLSLTLSIIANGEQMCDDVSFVNRAQWGAREPRSITNMGNETLSFYVIHHSASPSGCYDDESCIRRIKSIQNYHQNSLKWADIGYQFLIGENGKVYEGRGWHRQGAHSPGWNSQSYGICIIGNFTSSSPNQKAWNAVRSLIECGVKLGHVKKDYYILNHRQTQRPGYTICPGDGAANVINQWSRYCSFQYSGVRSNENEAPLTLALDFCNEEFKVSASN